MTAPPDRRRFPPEIAGERATLQGYLDIDGATGE